MKQRVSVITLGVSYLERARAFAAGATRSPTPHWQVTEDGGVWLN